MKEDDFYLQVANALGRCQLVELELKLYITQSLDLIKKNIGEKIPFNMKGDDYADCSLERLIDTFKKLSDNGTLVKELNNFKNKRNFLAHKAIADCSDYEGELFYSAAIELQPQLDNIQTEAERLYREIRKESHNAFSSIGIQDN